MKICKKCNTEKPLSEFGPHASTKDKLRNHCKKCHNEKNFCNCGNVKYGKSEKCRRCYGVNITEKSDGNKRLNNYGYVDIFLPNYPSANKRGYVSEHRLVMEKHLGRYLFPNENIHHINGIRDDNRIENLELWTRPQPKGIRIEDAIKNYIEFLNQYGYSVKKILE